MKICMRYIDCLTVKYLWYLYEHGISSYVYAIHLQLKESAIVHAIKEGYRLKTALL